MMKPGETMKVITCTIAYGDEYHKEGEKHIITERELDKVKQDGLRLQIEGEYIRKDISIWHTYPVYINVDTYRLEHISSESIGGGDRSHKPDGIIKHEKYEYRDPNDWMEHWP
jgi:hypothetical protein